MKGQREMATALGVLESGLPGKGLLLSSSETTAQCFRTRPGSPSGPLASTALMSIIPTDFRWQKRVNLLMLPSVGSTRRCRLSAAERFID